jgi:hypothetical protein
MAMKEIKEKEPRFVIASGIHERLGENERDQATMQRCARHLDFLGHIYEWQERHDRYYLHVMKLEEKDEVWKNNVAMNKKIRGIRSVSQPCFTMMTNGKDEMKSARMKVVSNSACIIGAFQRTQKARTIKRQFIRREGAIVMSLSNKESIKEGMMEQRICDEKDEYIIGVIKHASEEDKMNMDKAADKCHSDENDQYNGIIAYDDVSGTKLRPELVKQARREEIEYIKKLGVYKKVPKSKCHKETGKKPIQVRWIDVNKGDDKNPIYRSRLVAKDFKNSINLEWYAATPPLETLRTIISLAATKEYTTEGPNKLMVNDISRAYFYAPSTSPTFVDICDEDWTDGDEERCGELLVSMYGTRSAAKNWQNCYSGLLLSAGFTRGKTNDCIFYHEKRQIRTMVHGDDFVSVASGTQLLWLKGILESKFETKTTTIGPESKDEKTARVLNRIITFTSEGIEYEADQRHAEHMVRDMNMISAKSLSTPGTDEVYLSETKDELLNSHYESIYRSVTAKANYLAADRPDIQYATKECARGMSAPTEEHWVKLKRLTRYLIAVPRVVAKYKWQEAIDKLTIYSDANWAGDKKTRKSTSGGTIMWNGHYLKSWSKSQATVALSSAESELYACIKASSEGLGMISLLKDFGITVEGEIRSDASAALGIIARTGLGKLRHIDTSYLWIQQISAEKKMRFGKVDGKENVADIMTKNVSRELSREHCKRMDVEAREGRHERAPAVKD